jgi:hypothetical protein
VDGRELVALRDPEGFAEETAVLEPGALGLLALFDGTLSLQEIQELLLRHGQGLVPMELLAGLADSLDRCLLLENGRFEEARAARERDFLAAPVRAAAHAGSAYPEETREARAFLDRMLGLAPAAEPAPVSLLIAPHIDLGLGAEVYGHAHAALRASGRPDAVVVLGVAHAPLAQRFVACRKDFETPCGPVPVDAGLLDSLESRLGRDLSLGQSAHRGEHSIEFQALWLAHLWPERPPPIVPILVGSFHDFVERRSSPSSDPEVRAFADALRETVAAPGRRTVVLASVDLAHQGPRYGHAEGLGEAEERAMEAEDARLLERMAAGDAEGFFGEVSRGGNPRHVCGVAPIYLALLVAGRPGRLLRYGQGRIDPETGSVVSFAAMAFGE